MVVTTMDYRVGSHIPDSEILKRFKDEDGEIFLEVRGNENVLFRVTTGNQVYYKIEKSLMVDEVLTLEEDLAEIKPGLFPAPPVIEDTHPEVIDEHLENPFLLDESATGEEGVETLEDLVELRESEVEITELEEGEIVPRFLRDQCKKNTYGGFSLRFNRYLYLLDGDYRVEVKSPDAALSYEFDAELPVETTAEVTVETVASPDEKTVDSGDNGSLEEEIGLRLEKGDILPPDLQDQCEEDISSIGGHRIMIDDWLYLLDAAYRVTVKMKLSYSTGAPAPPPSSPAPSIKRGNVTVQAPPEKQLPAEEVVSKVVRHFEWAIDQYGINADFFKETVLGPKNRDILIRAHNGDLTELNDDTREAAKEGKNMVLQEKGFSLFRAALLHELYIKTTLTGRGDRMKYFITHIASIEADGKVNEHCIREVPDLEAQRETMKFFAGRGNVYNDKTQIINRVYRVIHPKIFKEFEVLRKAGEPVCFNALLIAGLYEHTTRMDRIEGVTMIRVCRDILDYGKTL